MQRLSVSGLTSPAHYEMSKTDHLQGAILSWSNSEKEIQYALSAIRLDLRPGGGSVPRQPARRKGGCRLSGGGCQGKDRFDRRQADRLAPGHPSASRTRRSGDQDLGYRRRSPAESGARG